ncbi:ABATE domain-containing protein, partial [Nocardia cyriacigeorgica]|uniref:ABATE domain-containing protein n=1 Tax=Nocardia cyriacigeorgica TaxID=135487 RepID=UPI0024543B72
MRAKATGRVLHDPKGGSFRFDAGAVCLDFAHTGGEGDYAKFESLHEPADLAEWLAAPPLSALPTAPVTADELTEAKALRQAIWVVAHARADGRPLPADAVAANKPAATPPPRTPPHPTLHTYSQHTPHHPFLYSAAPYSFGGGLNLTPPFRALSPPPPPH